MDRYINRKPQVHFLPKFDMKESTEWYGIKALWYEGATYQEKRTKVFALIGYPKMAEGQKVPAVVLVHGGGGHPYAEWIRRWNEKGYAAIAIDTTGYFPCEEFQGLVGTEKANEGHKYTRQLYGDLVEEGYTVGPDNSEMLDCDLPREEQWMYHAVADTILAHNILLNDPCVDSNKIGISGISWGGVITSIAIGYDSRYAFAIPIYGSGYLDELPAPTIPRIFGEKAVKELWSASERFEKVKFPTLWLCYCEDTCFHYGANSLSYRDTKEQGAFLSIKRGMKHSHINGWSAPEGYRFAEKTLCKELPLIRCISEPKCFGDISFEVEVPDDFEKVSARIFYLMEPAEYNEKNKLVNEWYSSEAEVHNGMVRGAVPVEAHGYFVECKGYIGDECYVSTSEWVVRK